jgi:ATP-dependent DNA helicase RecQ
MYKDDFKIDHNNLVLRKEKYLERVNAVIDYINNTRSCRSNLLAEYFSAADNKKCGICDNCINLAQQTLEGKEFEVLYRQILSFTKKEAVEITKLIGMLKPTKESHVWEAIDYLQSEDMIIQKPDGSIKVK